MGRCFKADLYAGALGKLHRLLVSPCDTAHDFFFWPASGPLDFRRAAGNDHQQLGAELPGNAQFFFNGTHNFALCSEKRDHGNVAVNFRAGVLHGPHILNRLFFRHIHDIHRRNTALFGNAQRIFYGDSSGEDVKTHGEGH